MKHVGVNGVLRTAGNCRSSLPVWHCHGAASLTSAPQSGLRHQREGIVPNVGEGHTRGVLKSHVGV